MKSAPLLLAYRYFWSRKHEQTVSFMMTVAGISIFIGSFSLTLITAVMNGFEYAIHQKIQNIHAPATIYSYGDPLAVDAVRQMLTTHFPEVIATSPQAISHALIYGDNDAQPTVVMLKGIYPNQEVAVSAIGSKLISAHPFVQAIRDNKIAIGKELAEQFNLSLGDIISLFYIEYPENTTRKVTVNKADAVVGAIFDTGIDEYDSGLIYCSLPFFETLFPDQGITQIGLSFAPKTNTNLIIPRLEQHLGLTVRPWQTLYSSLIAALALEKYAMFFILLLITLIASMNIVALIFMLISYKKPDIAILRALGMSYQKIQWLFIMIGISLSCIATLCGIGTAWVASVLLENYPFIQLPDAYYVSHLPSRMTFSIAVAVFMLVIGITFLASWFATRRIHAINIAHILRFEG